MVVLLLLLCGDVETNPGPDGEYIKLYMVKKNWNEDITLSIPGNKLNSDDLGCVLEEVLDVSVQWYQLGLQLKVKTGTLDRIRAQFSDPRDQLLEMLKTWLTTIDNTSWNSLTEALRSQSVGAGQLAGILEAKYCLVKKVEAGMLASDNLAGKSLAT